MATLEKLFPKFSSLENPCLCELGFTDLSIPVTYF